MRLGATSHTPNSNCTNCGRLHDAATPVGEKRLAVSPSSGSVAICIRCGHIMIYADDLSLRDPTVEEFLEVATDPRVIRARAAVDATEKGKWSRERTSRTKPPSSNG